MFPRFHCQNQGEKIQAFQLSIKIALLAYVMGMYV